ncbi:N-acetyltransferase 9-like protein [Clonorchis sinensis]|uniref:N-acetyltransferase 9-like protein n=1 Tax=Clonorchis sinensis TaxID=79923 RepID=A0A8T1MYF8_CLOSI|nr:N-acetyltransferase 9-like protein [Clonorchis sinensis]
MNVFANKSTELHLVLFYLYLKLGLTSVSYPLLDMRINRSVVLETSRLFLVPYCGFHVPRYHGWMQSEALRRATSSDLLNLEEEYEAQRLWAELDDRLTFILLAREKLKISNVPSPSLGDKHQQLEVEAMIGDVNLFLTPVQDEQHGSEFEGELSVMIAEQDFRGQGLAAEAVAALLHYSSSHLPNKISSLVAKVSLDNPASLRLFGDHLDFSERSRCEVFNQVDLVPPSEALHFATSNPRGDILTSVAQFVTRKLLTRFPTLAASGWQYLEHDLTTWRNCLLPTV